VGAKWIRGAGREKLHGAVCCRQYSALGEACAADVHSVWSWRRAEKHGGNNIRPVICGIRTMFRLVFKIRIACPAPRYMVEMEPCLQAVILVGWIVFALAVSFLTQCSKPEPKEMGRLAQLMPEDKEGSHMDLRGKCVYTGRMQLLNGWEVRPFAVKTPEGAFAPCLSTRKHAPGSPGKVFSFDSVCMNKEEAFELAMAHGLSLLAGV